jgi:glycerol-3-phosphate acyltransferase PlsY
VAVGIFIALALRYMSVMSMVTVPLGAVVLLLLAVFGVEGFVYTKTIFGAFATAFVILTHLPNIRRLIKGTEPKLGDPAEAKRQRRRGRARTTT